MTRSIFNLIEPNGGWLDCLETFLLSQLQNQVDDGPKEERPARLRAVQKEIRNIIGEACERLTEQVILHTDDAIAIASVADGHQSTPEDREVAEAGKEIFAIKNSSKLLEPNDVISGEMFIS